MVAFAWFVPSLFIALICGCARQEPPKPPKLSAACRKIELVDDGSPLLRLSYDEIGERTVSCNAFRYEDCEALLKDWACKLEADAVIVRPVAVPSRFSKSHWGRINRQGRAVRFTSTH